MKQRWRIKGIWVWVTRPSPPPSPLVSFCAPSLPSTFPSFADNFLFFSIFPSSLLSFLALSLPPFLPFLLSLIIFLTASLFIVFTLSLFLLFFPSPSSPFAHNCPFFLYSSLPSSLLSPFLPLPLPSSLASLPPPTRDLTKRETQAKVFSLSSVYIPLSLILCLRFCFLK